MVRHRRLCILCASGSLVLLLLHNATPVRASTEVKFDKDFLAATIEKLPPSPFEKQGQYRGTVHSYRLAGIDPKLRKLLASCQVEGEFRPPAAGPVSTALSSAKSQAEGLRKFRFEIKASVNIEANADAMPRFRVEIDEIKKSELEGIAGLLAKLLGKYFDEIVTQIADGRASLLNQKLNAEVLKRAEAFRQYGVFCGIDYAADHVVLRFDLTRFKLEGVVGYVYATPRPGTVPLYRWFDPKFGSHEYTLNESGPGRSGLVSEGIACHVLAEAAPGASPLYAWHSRRDHIYTVTDETERFSRRGIKAGGVTGFVHANPVDDTVRLYQFVDPRRGLHFYTTHPYAEFAK